MFEVVELGQRLTKAQHAEAQTDLRVRLVNAQYDVREQAAFSVSIVLAGDDRLGISDVVTLLNTWMDARYLRTHVLREPSDDEQDRPRYWRFWRRTPRRGAISLTSGGLASEILRPAVLGEIDRAGVERRCDRANGFERTIAADGGLIIKIWLHTPAEVMAKKLKKARKDPARAWLLTDEDHLRVTHRDRADAVAEDLIERTDTAAAPWHLIEATDRRYRDITVTRTIVDALEARLAGEPVASQAPPAEVPSDRLEPGDRTVLDAVDLSQRLERSEYRARLRAGQRRLNEAHRACRAEGRSTVVALEGWDAGGKGGAIRRVIRGLDAGWFHVTPIAAPTPEELDHHYLWRFWQRLPRAGAVQIFDRSWYGRVLVERVEGFATDAEWRRAYGEINDFERQLHEHGTAVVKLWLHIDADEQLRRFEARQQTPYKQYKITDEDWRNRERWGDYTTAVHDMVEHTSTTDAPWVLVAANDKRWARVQVVEALADAMEENLDR